MSLSALQMIVGERLIIRVNEHMKYPEIRRLAKSVGGTGCKGNHFGVADRRP